MTVLAIVPVKPLRLGKSRLAGVLTEGERVAMNQHMLILTLGTLHHVPEIEWTMVVSRDPAVLKLAQDNGALTVLEECESNLNAALHQATLASKQYPIHADKTHPAVLILPADLPLVEPEDVKEIIQHDPGPPGVVIVPDRHFKGTNALLLNPPGLMDYAFGSDSFQRHCEMSRKLGARLVILEMPHLAIDLDLPEDMELIRERMERL